MELKRRSFLFSLAALASAPPAELLPRLRAAVAAPAPLSETEKEVLGQFCEQLVPADEFPGARELGAVEFIERLLAEAHPEWTEVYRAGLRATDLSSRRRFQQPFAELPFERQTELLKLMEQGELESEDWNGVSQQSFFGTVLSHTMHGCYAHPQWGGNRGKRAWEMIGYDDWWV